VSYLLLPKLLLFFKSGFQETNLFCLKAVTLYKEQNDFVSSLFCRIISLLVMETEQKARSGENWWGFH